MLTYALMLVSLSLNLVCGRTYDSSQNNTSSFPSASIDSSSAADISNNLFFNGSSSSSPMSSTSALHSSVVPYDIYSSGRHPVHRTSSDFLVANNDVSNEPFTTNVFSSKSSPLVADNIFTSPPLLSQENTFFGSNYPCFRNILTTFTSDGPETGPLSIEQQPPLTLPCLEEPTITLFNPTVMEPRVISSKCICRKTVVKPQIYQRTITAPKISRYLIRTVHPIVENVAFTSKPITPCKCRAYNTNVLNQQKQDNFASHINRMHSSRFCC